MSDAARRLKANRKIEGKVCGWCQVPLQLGDDAAVCTVDEADHHAKCWDDKGGCSKPGCMNAPLKRLDAPPPKPQARPAAPPPGASAFGYGQPGPGPTTTSTAWDQAAGGYGAPSASKQPLRPGFKFCTGCGNQVPEHAQICDFCNAILTPDGIYHGPTTTAPGATASLVYGIIALVFCGIIFGILAIVKSREAKSAIAYNPRYSGGGMATAGFVCGIIGLIGHGLILILRVAALGS